MADGSDVTPVFCVSVMCVSVVCRCTYVRRLRSSLCLYSVAQRSMSGIMRLLFFPYFYFILFYLFWCLELFAVVWSRPSIADCCPLLSAVCALFFFFTFYFSLFARSRPVCCFASVVCCPPFVVAVPGSLFSVCRLLSAVWCPSNALLSDELPSAISVACCLLVSFSLYRVLPFRFLSAARCLFWAVCGSLGVLVCLPGILFYLFISIGPGGRCGGEIKGGKGKGCTGGHQGQERRGDFEASHRSRETPAEVQGGHDEGDGKGSQDVQVSRFFPAYPPAPPCPLFYVSGARFIVTTYLVRIFFKIVLDIVSK